jgi:hypothetical protein
MRRIPAGVPAPHDVVQGRASRRCLNHQHDLGPERQSDANQEGVTGMEGTGMNESGGDMGQTGDMKGTGDMDQAGDMKGTGDMKETGADMDETGDMEKTGDMDQAGDMKNR